MTLWIDNIGAEVIDISIKELLMKYGFPAFA